MKPGEVLEESALKSLRVTFERRLIPSRATTFLVPVLSLALAFATTGSLFIAVGVNPLFAYGKILGAFADIYGISESATRATALLLIAVGLAMAFKAGFWNIGAEGQLYMGAFAATGIVASLSDAPGALLIPAMIIAAFAAGGVWGLVPALLKAKLQVNEVLTTLMMNFIAMFWVDYLVYGPWRDPAGYGFPLTPMFPPEARLPALPGLRVHLGLIVGLLAALAIYTIMFRTRLGYEVKVAGQSLSAAKYAGIDYAKLIAVVMLISGGLSGVAGMSVVSGLIYRLRPRFSPGYGYMAIIVAWLAGLNPAAVILVAFLFGGLLVAGDSLQAALGLPVPIVLVFQSLMLIFLLAGEILHHYRIRLRLT